MALEGYLYPQADESQTFNYYYSQLGKLHEKFLEKRYGNFVDCWKEMHKRGWISPKIVSEKSSIEIVEDSSTNEEFFMEIVHIFLNYFQLKFDGIGNAKNPHSARK